jgi:hypothetical protein
MAVLEEQWSVVVPQRNRVQMVSPRLSVRLRQLVAAVVVH